MIFHCEDLERALEVPELLSEAREHAKVCDNCRRQLWIWGELSNLAPGLRQEWDTPDLWPRIRQALEAQQKADKPRGMDWRVLAGIAAALILAVVVFATLRYRTPQVTQTTKDGDFLTEQALREVERSEAAYRASIDKLSQLAAPKLNVSDNPAAVSGREKLLMLDAEISEVRSTAASNRFNARLQSELAILYREKQETLKEILQSGQTN